MSGFQEVLAAARSLSAADRARLVESLWEDVPAEEWPVPTAAWIAEVQQRSELFDAGKMTTSSWQEVRERARRRVGLDG